MAIGGSVCTGSLRFLPCYGIKDYLWEEVATVVVGLVELSYLIRCLWGRAL